AVRHPSVAERSNASPATTAPRHWRCALSPPPNITRAHRALHLDRHDGPIAVLLQHSVQKGERRWAAWRRSGEPHRRGRRPTGAIGHPSVPTPPSTLDLERSRQHAVTERRRLQERLTDEHPRRPEHPAAAHRPLRPL